MDFVVETMMFSDEPQRPQFLFAPAVQRTRPVDDSQSLPDFGPLETADDQTDGLVDDVLGVPNDGEGDQRRPVGGGPVISWRRNRQRWLRPSPGTSHQAPSFLSASDDYAAASTGDADDGLEPKVGREWMSAPDVSSDDQDYDLKFPVLQSVMSEKRIDVKKPGPHFDRRVSSFACDP